MRRAGQRQDVHEDVLNGSPQAVERSESRSRSANHEELPRLGLTRGRLLATGLFVASALAFLYFVLPKLLGLHETWNRIQHGNGWWLALAALLEVCSFGGYVWLFRGVFVRGHTNTSAAPGGGASGNSSAAPGGGASARSTGPRAIRSRWPAWRPPACSRPLGRVGSR